MEKIFNMKTVVCFGDSNTWGYTPQTGERYPYEDRWTGILQEQLVGHIRVIEEGLNGRTTSFDEPFRSDRNGCKALPSILETHNPLDLLIIALGANDLQPLYNASGYDSARGLGQLIELAKLNKISFGLQTQEVLIIGPTKFDQSSEIVQRLLPNTEEKFFSLLQEYEEIAKIHSCHYINSNEVIAVSNIDGVHIDRESHKKLGLVIAEKIRNFLL